MSLIQGCGDPCRERNSESPSKFLPLPKFIHNKSFVDSPIIDPVVNLSRFFVAKYIKDNLQKIFKTILKARASFSDRLYEKLLKAKSLDIYYGKFYIEYYNLC